MRERETMLERRGVQREEGEREKIKCREERGADREREGEKQG